MIVVRRIRRALVREVGAQNAALNATMTGVKDLRRTGGEARETSIAATRGTAKGVIAVLIGIEAGCHTAILLEGFVILRVTIAIVPPSLQGKF